MGAIEAMATRAQIEAFIEKQRGSKKRIDRKNIAQKDRIICGLFYFIPFHIFEENKISIGISSSRPASISNDKSSLESGLNAL